MMLYQTWLPFPVSVNKAYGGGSGQQRYKSTAYKEWEKKAARLYNKIKTITDPVKIEYLFFLPDRKSRDLSNFIKVTEDFLVKRGIILDDNYQCVPEFRASFGGYDKAFPRVEITISKAGT